MSKKMYGVRRTALLGSAATFVASFALGLGVTSVSAQDADEEVNQEVEEVVVTGSRIRNPNITSPSPVTVVGAPEIAARGTVNIEDLISSLPQAFAAASQGDFGGAGTAEVNLRGLGAERTLVLVNGKRLPFGQSNSAPADLNQIPSGLVERVEVLTGGASAVYGADAVAGVTNFIMKRDYEGLQVSGQAGIWHTGNGDDDAEAALEAGGFDVPGSKLDGFTYNVDVVLGTNTADDRGNITAYFTYRNLNGIVQADRVRAACAYGGGDPDFNCVGSSTTSPARISDFANFDIIAFDPTTGVARDYVGSGPVNDTFNFASTQRFQRPDQRYTFGAFAHYDITDNIEFYLDTMFSNTQSQGQIGPSGTFFRTSTLNCDNPFLSPEQVDAICTQQGLSGSDIATAFIGKRNVEGGPRQFNFSNTTFRVVTGLRGDLSDNWDYDFTVQYANVTNVQRDANDLIIPRIARAFDVVTDPDTGSPVCRSVLDGSDPNCVPYNVFQPGGITQEALDYLQADVFDTGEVDQRIITLTTSGDLTDYGFKSPWADNGVQAVFGFEYRWDSIFRTSDALSQAGQVSGSGGATLPVEGSLDVYEFFTELAIPLVEGKELVEELSASVAYRYSDYSTTGTSDTYAFGLTYAPTSDIKFRAQYQKATRSPNVFDLFLAQNTSLFTLPANANGLFDPCSGANPAATFEQCARSGVTADQYGNIADNPAGQFNSIIGGNPNLDVETADAYTLGVVFTPSFVPGLTLSVDYFDITVEDTIGTIPPALAVANCLADGNPLFCDLIQRDPRNGNLFADNTQSFVVATNVNTSELATSGIDINAQYSTDLPDGWGDLAFNYTATYLDENSEIAIPGADKTECAGLFAGSCVVPNPEYVHRFTTFWTTEGGIDVTATWRHVDGVTLQTSSEISPTNRDQHLSGKDYFDLSAAFNVTESLRLRVGVNNVFDAKQPSSASLPSGIGNGNTYPGTYEARGRFGFVGFSYDL